MDARLREGIRLFNAGRFFESHESLEDFYSRAADEHKPFLEGLVQLAAACRMFRDFAEVKGSVRMVRQAVIRLENYQPGYLGIRVSDLISALEEWAKQAEAEGEALKAEIPKIPLRRFFLF
jgi:predicted metal-dependent hydrolase